MKLSIIIPAYNEEKTIDEIVSRVVLVSLPIEKEIIIVDDGSSDSSGLIIQRKYRDNSEIIKIHTHAQNMGKGEAIKTGLKYVTGDIVIIQDADLELNPDEYIHLILPIINGESEVVYGSRFLRKSSNIPFITRLVNKLLAFSTNLLFGGNLTDEATSYKVIKTNLLKSLNLKCQGFEFCSEVTAKLLKKKTMIKEIPISYNPRNKKAGKKLRLYDGIFAVYTLLKYRFLD